jgi:hypothetical protein
VESGEMNNTQVVENFDMFPVSIYTPIYDKRSRSNDHWKSGAAAGNSSFQDRLTRTDIFGVESFSSRWKPRKLKTPRLWGNFLTFPRRDITPDFDIRRKKSKLWKLGRKIGRM